jgi:hypothetical protein
MSSHSIYCSFIDTSVCCIRTFKCARFIGFVTGAVCCANACIYTCRIDKISKFRGIGCRIYIKCKKNIYIRIILGCTGLEPMRASAQTILSRSP